VVGLFVVALVAAGCVAADDPGPGTGDAAPPPVSSTAAGGDGGEAPVCGPLPEGTDPASGDVAADDPTATDSAPGDPGALPPGSLAHLVPAPSSVVVGEGRFVVDEAVAIVVADPVATVAACLLRDELARATGVPLRVHAEPPDVDDDARPLVFSTPGSGPTSVPVPAGSGASREEGYRLTVTPDRIDVVAASSAGHGWAVQTLLQAAPPEVHSPFRLEGRLEWPAGTVDDAPRFAWRGLMVDIARHFFGPAELRRVIDLMASYKLNVLHLHLTDDQGWRIEIAGYPALTEVGGATEVGGGPGGFLTKDDYRDLVAYAARRGITVVPEIDLPGHTNAALVAVPELTCDGVAPDPYTGMSVGFSTLCLGEPAVDRFVETVLTEVAEMTPGPWLHIGGDESHATDPVAYEAFVADTAALVRSLGKVPVGWEEVGGAAPDGELVVQHWLDADRAAEAARSGARVVLSPSSRLYFDMAYGPFAPEGNGWAGTIDTPTVVGWDPASYLAGVDAGQILGVEAPLWTELVETPDDIDRRLLPRLPALAELAWSRRSEASWDDLAARLAEHEARWTAAGRSFTPDPAVPWP
jgi:hexosaminidase